MAVLRPTPGRWVSDEVSRLVVEEAGGADEVFDVFLPGGGERFGVGIFFEEGGRHEVDPHVGALGRENGGDEELEGALVVQLAVGVGIGGAQSLQNGGSACGPFHAMARRGR